MNELQKLNFEIMFWSFIFNPGAIMLGLGMHAITVINDPLISFLSNTNRVYAFIAVGAVIFSITTIRVHKLTKKRNDLNGNT